MSAAIDAACDAAMHRIKKHINAQAGQHMRAIRKGFEQAGAPVTGAVSVPAQRRMPLVGDLSEGTESARRINRCPYKAIHVSTRAVDCVVVHKSIKRVCVAGGCNYPEGQCEGACA